MTFTELKDTIISRVRLLEVCPNYQALLLATDQAGLLTAAMGIIEWVYTSGVVDDSMLAEFDTATLHSNGVYIGSNTLTNPPDTTYLIGPGINIVTVTGTNRAKIVQLGGNSTSVVLQDYGFANIKTAATSTVLSMDTNTSACLQTLSSNATVVTNSGTLQANCNETSILEYNGDSGSAAIIRVNNYATLQLNTTTGVVYSKYKYATINQHAS